MKLFKNILIIIGAAISLGLVFTPNANAQDVSSAQGLQISPAKVELNAAKGNTYSVKLTVTNVTSTELVYTSSISDFKAAGETGSPKITVDTTMPSSASIRSWVSDMPDFTLGAHESTDINAQIVIPDNAEPGGHYGVISFSGSAPDISGTGVGLSASAGVIMLIRVDGDITESASLSSFYSGSLDNQSFFFETGPIPFVVRVKNDGNVHIKPVGTIEVRDMFGNSVASVKVNNSQTNVLPDSIRRFGGSTSDTLQLPSKGFMIGLYTAQLTLGYGQTGQALTSSISFWIIPYKAILIILLVMGTIIYIVITILKVYNKRIIEKYKNENGQKANNKKTNKK